MSTNEYVTGDEFHLFLTENKSVPKWDNPNFKVKLKIPENYTPITMLNHTIRMIEKGTISQDALVLLKVIGDSLCVNEYQIKKMIKLYSEDFGTSHTSRLLRNLTRYGLIDQYTGRNAFAEDDEEKYPSIFTLGFAGIHFLQHYYNDMYFVRSNIWKTNSYTIQRYLAINEVRLAMILKRKLIEWSWSPAVRGSSSFIPPTAVARVRLSETQSIQFVIERTHMRLKYIAYISERLNGYQKMYQADNKIRVDGMPNDEQKVVLISVSTSGMARTIMNRLQLQNFKFPIWFIVDEWLEQEDGIQTAFARVVTKKETDENGNSTGEELPYLERFRLPVFA